MHCSFAESILVVVTMREETVLQHNLVWTRASTMGYIELFLKGKA